MIGYATAMHVNLARIKMAAMDNNKPYPERSPGRSLGKSCWTAEGYGGWQCASAPASLCEALDNSSRSKTIWVGKGGADRLAAFARRIVSYLH